MHGTPHHKARHGSIPPLVAAYLSEAQADEIFQIGVYREELAQKMKTECDPVAKIALLREKRSLNDKAIAERYKIPASIVRRCIQGV